MLFFFKKLFQKWFQSEIYLDHASTTRMDHRVFSVIKKIIRGSYGNAGGMYPLGVRTAQVIGDARKLVARLLGTQAQQIIFTRGGTESNNIAIQGVVAHFRRHNPGVVPHIITSTIEHDSVLNVVKNLEKNREVTATYIPCDADGIVAVEDIKKELRPETILISIMHANNEIGTIQPIRNIAKLVRWWKKQQSTSLPGNKNPYPLLHTDAIQAANYYDLNPLRLGVDLMTLSGSKIHGPKSAGMLYVQNKELLDPIIYGGGHEYGLRSGTEDAAVVAGFAKALEISQVMKENEVTRLTSLRDDMIAKLLKDERIILNGSKVDRLPNNINITIKGFKSEELVIQLAAHGFAVSAKSACQADTDEESHVITALRSAQGATANPEEGSLRITLGRKTTHQCVNKFINVLKKLLS